MPILCKWNILANSNNNLNKGYNNRKNYSMHDRSSNEDNNNCNKNDS